MLFFYYYFRSLSSTLYDQKTSSSACNDGYNPDGGGDGSWASGEDKQRICADTVDSSSKYSACGSTRGSTGSAGSTTGFITTNGVSEIVKWI